MILVRSSKFDKARDLPVSASTINALACYRPAGTEGVPPARLLVRLRSGTAVAYTDFEPSFRDSVLASGVGS